jgi:hypothetical protein
MGGDATKRPVSVRPIRRRPTIADPRRRNDIVWLAALTAVLLVWFLGPFVVFGYAFPVGPDGPVYLWWTRLAGAEGLSVVERPGIPALALTLTGTFGLPFAATLAALECALGVAVGTAAAVLVRRTSAPSIASPLAGLLAGTFAVHLAAGYVANLAMVAAFIATACLLATGTRAGAIGAAAVLGAGGLAHPVFLAVAIAILLGAAALGWPTDRSGSLRVASSAAAAGAIGALAWMWLQVGPPPLDVDTSRDAFLRRVGLTDVLRSAYLDRLVHRWARYVQWASIPLAAFGITIARGFVGRFLIAWLAVTVVGVGAGALTGAFPPDRFITFGFAIPILAALGVARLPSLLGGRRAIALSLGAALTVAMLAGAFIAWARQEPFISTSEVHDIEDVGRYAVRTDPAVAVVFEVDDDDGEVSFEATRLNNVIRAALPPSLIRRSFIDVLPPDGPSSEERQALSGVLAPGDAQVFDPERSFLTAYIRSFGAISSARLGTERISRDVVLGSDAPIPAPAPAAITPLEPAMTVHIALGAMAALAMMCLAGYGPARVVLKDRLDALGVAPAVGVATLMLVAFVLERLGVPLDGRVGPSVVSVVALVGGLAFGFVGERRAIPEPPA